MKNKHTKGEWSVSKSQFSSKLFGTHTGFSIHSTSNMPLRSICNITLNNAVGIPENEREANAKLIAEAGTVANECGLSPRQLLDQRNMLLIELKSARNIIPHLMEGESEETKRGVRPHLEAIKKAIKKATE